MKPALACILVAALVALVIVLIAAIALSARQHEDFLSGMWVGSAAFLEKAKLSDMQLYIAPPEGGRRQAYLLMVDARGEFVANQAVEMTGAGPIRRWWSAAKALWGGANRGRYVIPDLRLSFDGGEAVMPETVKAALSVRDGSLTLFDGSKVYAFLYKDAQASSAANEAYGAP